MLSYGISEFDFFRFYPEGGTDYVIEHMQMVKAVEKGLRIRVPEILGYGVDCVRMVEEITVDLDKPFYLVDFSAFKVPHRFFFAGRYTFNVLSVVLPLSARTTPLEIVVLPDSFFGLALIGLENILIKQARARTHAEAKPHPFLPAYAVAVTV